MRLLANLAPAGTVVFGLITAWLVVTTAGNLGQPLTPPVVASLVLGAAAALLAGFVTYRLGVEVPRTLRDWEAALGERSRALRDD